MIELYAVGRQSFKLLLAAELPVRLHPGGTLRLVVFPGILFKSSRDSDY